MLIFINQDVKALLLTYQRLQLERAECGGEPYSDEIENTPRIWLVHDAGCYLMTNGLHAKNSVIYAKGCDPQKDEDCYETARHLVGGSDFANDIPIEWIETVANHPTAELKIEATENELRLIA